ncbi:MAG: DUF1501 domain-containing protein [Myxococcota bacterium]
MTHPLALTRRRLIQAAAATAGVGMLGSMDALLAHQAKAAGVGDRKFIFFFAGGGWDATPLDPKFDVDGGSPLDGTDMDPGTMLGKAGNLSWSSGPDRPNMDVFFQRWGHKTALARGVNVHSAGHESGTQWMMTGTTTSSRSDWPTIIAANGQFEYPMPHLVFSGPAYPGSLGAAVVRGGGGSLLRLIDGTLNARVDRPAPVISAPSDSMMDAYIYNRSGRVAQGMTGQAAKRMDDYMGNLERASELEGRRFEAGLGNSARGMLAQAEMALEVMRLGLTRCAMIRIPGGWDTHGGNQNVGNQMDNFFGALDQLFEKMHSTPGQATPLLAGEVVVVATSELGRTPRFNGSQGRDHWPYTSMLIAGSGIKGDNVVGETDNGFITKPIDFSTGKASSGGDRLGTEHIGVTLLKHAGVDPERWLPGIQQVPALLRS